MDRRRFVPENMPPRVRDMKYALRGKILEHATQIEEKLAKDSQAFKHFDKLVYANIGDPQKAGQKCLTFPRQVLALMMCPSLLEQQLQLLRELEEERMVAMIGGGDSSSPLLDHDSVSLDEADRRRGLGSTETIDESPVHLRTSGGPGVVTAALLQTRDGKQVSPKKGNNGGGVTMAPSLTSTACSSSASGWGATTAEVVERVPLVTVPAPPGLLFPSDAIRRAAYLSKCAASLGCYSESKGVAQFRAEIAEWFRRRDNFPVDPCSIFLTNGASGGVRMVIELLARDTSDGILIPVPQYPLYDATIVRLGGTAIKYYLDEEAGWSLDVDDVKTRIAEAVRNKVTPRALVLINPGNPTGSVLSRDTIEQVVKICEEENLVLLADEVYQQNIYDENIQFVSVRKVAMEMKSSVQLISFHSASKGLSGECGMRGGLMQLENCHSGAVAMAYKIASVSLCANTIGQAMMTLTVTPPNPGDPSYPLYKEETDGVFRSLQKKAKLATDMLNASCKGVTCQPITGAMYAFPRIQVPQRAMEEARKQDVEPDMLFCLELLESRGIVSVPGSGFGQMPGTYHVRLTLLPELENFTRLLQHFTDFYQEFVAKYGDGGDDDEQVSVATTAAPLAPGGGSPSNHSDDDRSIPASVGGGGGGVAAAAASPGGSSTASTESSPSSGTAAAAAASSAAAGKKK